jgi:hypothetical protein
MRLDEIHVIVAAELPVSVAKIHRFAIEKSE